MAILRILTTEVGAPEQVLTLGDRPVRLGRADDNDVILLEQSASRHHARIEPAEDGYEVVDLGSSGGVQLDGNRITRHHLREGDELVIGGTRIRFVEHPGSERTILPTAEAQRGPARTRPSSQSTEVGDVPDLGDADTILPTGLNRAPTGPQSATDATVQATHEPAPPPAAPDLAPLIPGGTVQAVHRPVPPPAAPPIELETVEPPKQHPSSDASFVMGAGPSSPSNYTLEANGPGGSTSGGYSLDGDRGGFALDTMPPTALRRGPGAGVYVLLALVGAAASFGILIALQGTPW